MYMYISILCARTIPGLSRSMVCARAIRGLRGQSMVCGTNHGSRVCAGQSRDCANPCFAHNSYIENHATIYRTRRAWNMRRVEESIQVGAITGKKIVFRTLGFILSTLGSVPSNVFTVVLGTLNTFDGTDPKVDRLKPKVRNTIIFPVHVGKRFLKNLSH